MISLDIVTPSKEYAKNVMVSLVKIPTSCGEIEVLPNHTALFTLLDTGILSYIKDGLERKFAVSYGFAEIKNDRVIVLAETCEEASEIDYNRAKAALDKAQKTLSSTLTREEFTKFERKLRRAITRINLSGK